MKEEKVEGDKEREELEKEDEEVEESKNSKRYKGQLTRNTHLKRH